jgi:hypothetical protein
LQASGERATMKRGLVHAARVTLIFTLPQPSDGEL